MNSSKQQLIFNKVEPARFVLKPNGNIKGYAVNTFHGLVKQFNEDRVSIIMNITKPQHKGHWPKCSYFGVFDGHGGDACSNFLKDNLHKFITENSHFPAQPIDALKSGFKKAEYEFLKYAQSKTPVEKSGSCAIVVLMIDSCCYIANVGDSRAILSSYNGQKTYPLSQDHKPNSQFEKQRIEKANGKIYQSSFKSKNGEIINGPFRIIPGKLSVSRAFGDIEAKLQKYGGNPKVLIAKPDITYFEINHSEHDFIVMGSDGIYDKLSNSQITNCFWKNYKKRSTNSYDFIGEACSDILNESMAEMSTDNITSLVIVFEDNGRLDLPKSNVLKIEERELNRRQQEKQNQAKMMNMIKSNRSTSNINTKFESTKQKVSKICDKSSTYLKRANTSKNLSTSFKSTNKIDREKQSKRALLEKIMKHKQIDKIR